MPLYVISWMDKPDSLQVRMGAREAHLAYAKTLGDKVKLGGPFLDEDGQMAGSLIIIEAADMAAAEAFSLADPYRKAGLFERVEIRPWKATFGELP